MSEFDRVMYPAEVWLGSIAELHDSMWSDGDVVTAVDREIAKLYRSVPDEDLIRACVWLCADETTAFDAAYLRGALGRFTAKYQDLHELRQQFLDDHYPGTEVDWYKDNAPLWAAVLRETEQLVEGPDGLYIFKAL